MGAFNKVTAESLENVQINAGMILNSFSPSNPTAPTSSTIVCATTGGITATCTPTFEDFGSDIDNCPNNTKELKRITAYECTLAFTAVEMTADTIKLALGAASSISGEVQPRKDVINADFKDIWFVSERVDDKVIAIKLKNALSTGGFSYKTQKDGKGNLSVTLTGHISISNPDDVPMVFYIADASNVPTSVSSVATQSDD